MFVVAPDHLLRNARVLGEVDLPGLVHGGREEVLLAGKDVHDLPALVGGNDGELLLVGLDLDAAAEVELLVGFAAAPAAAGRTPTGA